MILTDIISFSRFSGNNYSKKLFNKMLNKMRGRTILTLLFIIQILFPQQIVALNLKAQQLQTVIAPDDPYWTGQCAVSQNNQSPINIVAPFTYMDFKVDWNLQEYFSGVLFNDEGFNLKMEGDFGNFIYEGKTFSIYELRFKSPSEHTFGPDSKHLPLEMQMSSISPDAIKINLAVLFTENDEDGEFLADFGFGDGILQHLSSNQKYQVKQPVDLDKIVPKASNWLIYSGTDTTPPCSPAVWLIAYDTFKVSVKQLDDFPKQLIYKNRKVTIDNREIFSSFKTVKTDQNTDEKPETTTAAEALTEPDTIEEKEAFDRKRMRPQRKSPYFDSFSFIADDTPYIDQIYPCLLNNPNPRPIKSEEYIVVNNAKDARPYLEYLVLKDDQVREVLNDIENKKITSNLAREEEMLKEQRERLGIESSSEDQGDATADNEEKAEETEEESKEEEEEQEEEQEEEEEEQVEEEEEEEEEEATEEPAQTKATVLIQNEKTKPIAFSKTFDHSGVDVLGLDSPKKKEQKLVQVVKAPVKKDPSMFFGPSHPYKNKIFKEKGQQKFLSFLQLKSKVEVLEPVEIYNDQAIKEWDDTEKHINDPKLTKEIEQYFQKLLTGDTNLEVAEGVAIRDVNVDGYTDIKIAPEVHKKVGKETNLGEIFLGVDAQTFAQNESEGEVEDPSLENGEATGEETGEEEQEEEEEEEEQPEEDSDVDEELKEQAKDWKKKPLEVVDLSSSSEGDESDVTPVHSDDGLYIEKDEEKKKERNSDSQDEGDIPLKGRPDACYDDNKPDSSSSVEEEYDSDEGEDQPETKDDRVDEDKKMVFGPKVPNEVKKKFAIEQGRGSMAFDSEGNWDGVNILDTVTWPDLCKIGAHQSPVHISFKTQFLIEPDALHFHYKTSDEKFVQLKNDGNKLAFYGNLGQVFYGEHPFYVEEVHFHHPSEHTYGDNMERADLEVQIIHRDQFGLTVAISVMFKKNGDQTHKFLDDIGIRANTDLKSIEPGQSAYIDANAVDLNSLVDGAFDFIRYIGSLTTPPCTEGVYWFLLNNQLDINEGAINAFKKILGRESNVRGTQPLNGRDFWLL